MLTVLIKYSIYNNTVLYIIMQYLHFYLVILGAKSPHLTTRWQKRLSYCLMFQFSVQNDFSDIY